MSVDLIDKEDFENSDHYHELAGQWVKKQIDQLSELGYQPGDIAVLVRWNSEGKNIVHYLEAAQAESDTPDRYRFMSNETIVLGNNQAIRLLMAAIAASCWEIFFEWPEPLPMPPLSDFLIDVFHNFNSKFAILNKRFSVIEFLQFVQSCDTE